MSLGCLAQGCQTWQGAAGDTAARPAALLGSSCRVFKRETAAHKRARRAAGKGAVQGPSGVVPLLFFSSVGSQGSHGVAAQGRESLCFGAHLASLSFPAPPRQSCIICPLPGAYAAPRGGPAASAGTRQRLRRPACSGELYREQRNPSITYVPVHYHQIAGPARRAGTANACDALVQLHASLPALFLNCGAQRQHIGRGMARMYECRMQH